MTPTPLTVYGEDLYQWLRSDNVTLNAGVTVSTWQDLSGKGNDGVQGSGTAQPAYTLVDATLDNQPTVASDGANDVLQTTGLTVDLATEDLYFCAVLKQLSWTSSDKPCGGNGTTHPRLTQTGSTPRLAQGSVNSNSSAALGTWVRAEALWTTTSGVSYLKLGATPISGGNPGTGTRTITSLFADSSSAFWNGALAEVIYVKRPAGSGGPTTGERAAIDAYLQALYPSAVF